MPVLTRRSSAFLVNSEPQENRLITCFWVTAPMELKNKYSRCSIARLSGMKRAFSGNSGR